LRKNSGLNIEDWQIKTNSHVKGEIGDRPSAYLSRGSKINNSLIARGCVIEGIVKNSILSPGVMVRKDTVISNSIIFNDTVIGPDSVIEKSIIDKSVNIDEKVHLGYGESKPNEKFPHHLFTGITVIGKGAKIPKNLRIGKNCIINPYVSLVEKGLKEMGSGMTV